MSFWTEIDAQLDRIESEKPQTFDEVRAILLDPAYAEVASEVNRNGVRDFDAYMAFFAGSGGDRALSTSLREAGWRQLWCEASYHYAMYSPSESSVLTYVEGNVLRGNHAALTA